MPVIWRPPRGRKFHFVSVFEVEKCQILNPEDKKKKNEEYTISKYRIIYAYVYEL